MRPVPLILIGAIAQLGERLHGMQEVSGSIPLSSTKYFYQYKVFGAKIRKATLVGL